MNLFNALSQITRYGSQKGDNAVARMKHLNDIINNLAPSYAVSPKSGDIGMSARNSRQVLNSPTISTVYNVTLLNAVTNGLGAGKKINIATVNTSDYGFTIDSIRFAIGVNTAKYDGGDLELYLGDTFVGKIKAETLTAIKEGKTAEFLVSGFDAMQIGAGDYTADSSINIDYYTTLNIRTTSATVDFKGLIAVTIITTAKASGGCGTYCDDCTGSTKGSAGLKCSSGKCAICKSSAFTVADVVVV